MDPSTKVSQKTQSNTRKLNSTSEDQQSQDPISTGLSPNIIWKEQKRLYWLELQQEEWELTIGATILRTMLLMGAKFIQYQIQVLWWTLDQYSET